MATETQALPTELTIEVTAQDIALGVAMQSRYCPIALAGERAVRGVVLVSVGDEYINFGELDAEGQWVGVALAKLPPEATRFVEAFDRGAPVQPFTFTVRPHD